MGHGIKKKSSTISDADASGTPTQRRLFFEIWARLFTWDPKICCRRP